MSINRKYYKPEKKVDSKPYIPLTTDFNSVAAFKRYLIDQKVLRDVFNKITKISKIPNDLETWNRLFQFLKNMPATQYYYQPIPLNNFNEILAEDFLAKYNQTYADYNYGINVKDLLKQEIGRRAETNQTRPLSTFSAKTGFDLEPLDYKKNVPLPSMEVASFMGLTEPFELQTALNPDALKRSAYLNLDTLNRVLTDDGTMLKSWDFSSLPVSSQGSVNSVQSIRDIVQIQTAETCIPIYDRWVHDTHKKIFVLIKEFSPQAYIREKGRRYHFVYDADTKLANSRSDPDPPLYKIKLIPVMNWGKYKFEKPVTTLNSLTLQYFDAYGPITFDPDCMNFIVASNYNANPVLFDTADGSNHNLYDGDIVYFRDFKIRPPMKTQTFTDTIGSALNPAGATAINVPPPGELTVGGNNETVSVSGSINATLTRGIDYIVGAISNITLIATGAYPLTIVSDVITFVITEIDSKYQNAKCIRNEINSKDLFTITRQSPTQIGITQMQMGTTFLETGSPTPFGIDSLPVCIYLDSQRFVTNLKMTHIESAHSI